MQNLSLDIFMDRRTRRTTIVTGVVLLVLGLIGVVMPQVITVAVSLLISFLLVLSGAVVAYLTWINYSRTALAWLKPFLLIALGLLIGLYPAAGAAAMGLVLIIYFLLDGFASISFSFVLRPLPGWGWTLFNGILSMILACVFLVSWPFSAMWLVGLLVGISLMVDGLALLMLGLSARKF
ncbi:HdeD family acid-resistance protein [Desulfolithobacter sp.]